MENTAFTSELKSSHGLCFYIETKNHKILFDMGPDAAFLENAEKLGVDIGAVDLAILSHGHYDHGGGLEAFLQANTTAPVHMQKKAFGEFYAHDPDGTHRYIGLPQKLKDHPRLICHTGDYKLDADIQVFAGITGRECYSPANDRLYMSLGGREIPDLFMHEQNLLIKERDKIILVAGCAHNGIVNILNKADTFTTREISYVISGMHLQNACPDEKHQKILCHTIADRLNTRPGRYYTCHCTGLTSYEMLHEELGDKIQYLSTGSILEVD
jgi:7,8-dihydropterin-6-yl-methyl-4-(beta-D-ribofuranosyl)aminobenzene 5'-phosphate synthase